MIRSDSASVQESALLPKLLIKVYLWRKEAEKIKKTHFSQKKEAHVSLFYEEKTALCGYF